VQDRQPAVDEAGGEGAWPVHRLPTAKESETGPYVGYPTKGSAV
jgi:hypothetical protein